MSSRTGTSGTFEFIVSDDLDAINPDLEGEELDSAIASLDDYGLTPTALQRLPEGACILCRVTTATAKLQGCAESCSILACASCANE